MTGVTIAIVAIPLASMSAGASAGGVGAFVLRRGVPATAAA